MEGMIPGVEEIEQSLLAQDLGPGGLLEVWAQAPRQGRGGAISDIACGENWGGGAQGGGCRRIMGGKWSIGS